MSELTPLVERPARRVLRRRGRPARTRTTELRLIASYGYKERKDVSNRFKIGEGLVGQAALERKTIVITQAPEDYIKIASGPRRGGADEHHRPAGAVRGAR